MARCVSCTIIGSNVYDESNEWIIFKYELLKRAKINFVFAKNQHLQNVYGPHTLSLNRGKMNSQEVCV